MIGVIHRQVRQAGQYGSHVVANEDFQSAASVEEGVSESGSKIPNSRSVDAAKSKACLISLPSYRAAISDPSAGKAAQ